MKISVRLSQDELLQAVAQWLDKQPTTSQHAPWNVSNIEISTEVSYEGYGTNERAVHKVKVVASSE